MLLSECASVPCGERSVRRVQYPFSSGAVAAREVDLLYNAKHVPYSCLQLTTIDVPTVTNPGTLAHNVSYTSSPRQKKGVDARSANNKLQI